MRNKSKDFWQIHAGCSSEMGRMEAYNTKHTSMHSCVEDFDGSAMSKERGVAVAYAE